MKFHHSLFGFILLSLFLHSCSGESEEDDNQDDKEDYQEVDSSQALMPVLEEDSLELIWLYNNTNGENWTNQWDLTQTARSWYGVRTDTNGAVTYVDLSNNNLTGDISSENLADHISFNIDFRGNPFKAFYASTERGIIMKSNTHRTLENPFKISDTVAYVLRKEVPVYATPDASNQISTLHEYQPVYGNINYDINGPIEENGYRGDYILVRTQDTTGYVFSGFLSRICPPHTSFYTDWLRVDSFYLEGYGVTNMGGDFMPSEGEFTWNYYYNYEYGIKLWNEDGWEWGGTRISFPTDLITIQEAFLLGNYIVGGYREIFENQFPSRAKSSFKPNDHTSVEVDFNAGGEFVGFEIRSGDEFYMETTKFLYEDGYFTIQSFL